MSTTCDGDSKPRDLWDQILAVLVKQISPQSFDCWLRPIVFVDCNETSCEVAVPNETFRALLLDNYGEVLRAAVSEVLGAPCQLLVSVRPDKSDQPLCSGPLPLPVVLASSLKAATPDDQWLIQHLWMAEAVGIIGGPPRAYKSWLALDMAVSVASGSPCLGVFPVHCCGPVLLYAAEDSASSLRSRLESLARSRRVDFAHLDIRVITIDFLRLDRATDQARFEATVALHRPRLLILDPLVRIHGADENASGAMAALLGYFRALQRKTAVAIVLVHHARKNVSGRSGYSLRGSSDFYAWTDCLLYLERRRDQRSLVIEHRSAPGLGPFAIELVTPSEPDHGPYLRLHQDQETDPLPKQDSLNQRILDLLSKSAQPLPADTIRLNLQARKQRVLQALRSLSQEDGNVVRLPQGYTLKPHS